MTEAVPPVDVVDDKVGEASALGLADPLADLEAVAPLTRRDNRRNFTLGLINGALFRIGDIFIDTEMVLTWFLSQLGASNFLIGFVWPLRFGASFLLQMLVSGYVERQPYKRPLYRTISIFRCAMLLIFALLVVLVPVGPWLIAAFFAALTLFSLGTGLASLPFMDVVGKVIPPRRRGAFFGQRMFWGGLVALGGSAIIGFLLSEPGGLRFPLNVAVMFVLASIFYGLTAWSWILIKEPPSPLPATAQQGVVGQVVAQFRRGFQTLEENVVYRRYVWVRLALIAAGWAGPFLVVYAQRELGIAAGLLGLYLGVRTAGGILSNLLWGRISDGLGNRKLIIATTAVGAATPILALMFGWLDSAAPASTAWLTYAFALVFLAAGMFGPGSAMGLTNYLLDVAPDEQRPLYLAFTNTLFGLARFMGLLGGLIVDWAGFDILFGAAAIFYLIAFLLSIRLAEPRDQLNREL